MHEALTYLLLKQERLVNYEVLSKESNLVIFFTFGHLCFYSILGNTKVASSRNIVTNVVSSSQAEERETQEAYCSESMDLGKGAGLGDYSSKLL